MTKKINVSALLKGQIVRASRRLDPLGANVKRGTVGFVLHEANYHRDNGGPIVRWPNDKTCNVYQGEVRALPGTIENIK